jgi:aspartyl/glutamyl-tRNA(Asn/Gln) amidotransferase C subunit
VSISLEEVRHIAALARLGIDDARAAAIAVELSSILDHMQVLAEAETAADDAEMTDAEQATVLRADSGLSIPLARLPNDFAPLFRDGFFLVPRLATHEDLGASS